MGKVTIKYDEDWEGIDKYFEMSMTTIVGLLHSLIQESITKHQDRKWNFEKGILTITECDVNINFNKSSLVWDLKWTKKESMVKRIVTMTEKGPVASYKYEGSKKKTLM